jgi:hypothetical protein
VVSSAFLCLKENAKLVRKLQVVLKASYAVLGLKYIEIVHLAEETSKLSSKSLQFKRLPLLPDAYFSTKFYKTNISM